VVSSVVTSTCSTCSSLIVRAAPGRGSSARPSRRRATNRERHLVTVGREMPSWVATADLSALVFTGPGGGPGGSGGPGVPKGARTVLSRHNFHRTYHAAVAKLADPTGELRTTAARVLKALRAGGPYTLDRLTAALADRGRAIRPLTVQIALGELAAAGLVACASEDNQQRLTVVLEVAEQALKTHPNRSTRRVF
jgi:hypothetical protein